MQVFSTGQTIVQLLDGGTDGEVATVSAVTAAIKPTERNLAPPASVPVAASFVVTPRAAANGFPAGWTLRLAAGLAQAGTYCFDVRITYVDGTKDVFGPVFFRVVDAVTA